jgi:hypothetical protein
MAEQWLLVGEASIGSTGFTVGVRTSHRAENEERGSPLTFGGSQSASPYDPPRLLVDAPTLLSASLSITSIVCPARTSASVWHRKAEPARGRLGCEIFTVIPCRRARSAAWMGVLE